MTIAAKHMDPIMGIDTHIVQIPTPAGPVPTPLPNPYVGMVFDEFDYIPMLGGTVYINGMMRAQAGTGGKALPPHLPLGGPLVPPATNESEIFMGSATVATDGDAQSLLGMMVLSCQSIGMPAPIRPKGQPPKSLVLPTSTVLSIPMGPPVLIGGPPTISLMALGMRAGMAALGKLGGILRRAQRGAGRFGDAMRAITRRANAAGDKLADILRLGPKGRQRIENAICTVTGHPVDVATGRVFTEQTDFELPGPIPFAWKRSWSSTSTYVGDLGHGWHHSYQLALYVKDDVVLYRDSEGRAIAFPPLKQDQQFFLRRERLTLSRGLGGYALTTRDRLTYHFRDIGRPNDEHVLSYIENPVGDAIELRYDDRGRLAELVDSGGRQLRFTHDDRGRILRMDAPHPDDPTKRVVVVEYAYDSWGDLFEVRDALGQPMRFQYKDHLLVRETNRNGLSFYFEYDGKDANAKCLRTWGDGGIYDHKLTYDDALGITTVTDSLGHRMQYQHIGGLVVRIVDPFGASSFTEYDADNRVIKETDPLGQQTLFEYDSRGNRMRVTQPDGAAVIMEHDEFDRPVRAIDALGSEWRWAYDEFGRLLESTDAIGRSRRYGYAGRRLSLVANARGATTAVAYDASGNLIAVQTLDGSYRRSYDGWGRVLQAEDPRGNVETRRYDLFGRLTHAIEPDGNVFEQSFDPEGNVLQATTLQRDVRFTYQGMNRLASRTEAGRTVTFEYDSEEQLVAIHNEHGRVYRFELDAMGKVSAEIAFDDATRWFERDLAGQVTTARRPGGRETCYVYDSAGRITELRYGDGTRARFDYRADGELVGASNDAVALAFERDPLGRIVKEVQGNHWVESEHDLAGFRVGLRTSLGAELSVERNELGDPLKVAHGSAWTAHFTRDMGLEVARALPGGIQSRWERDALGRPVKHEIMHEGRSLRAVGYRWGVADRLEMVVDSEAGPTQYWHDALGNLVGAARADGRIDLRMPDAVGNLFRSEGRDDREYGAGGQLLRSRDSDGRTTTYRYDEEGNLAAKTDGFGRTWRYRWNDAGQLARVIRPDRLIVHFSYDPLGRRLSKTFRGQTTCWLWDGNNPLHEWTSDAALDLPERDLSSTESPVGDAPDTALHPPTGPPGEAPVVASVEESIAVGTQKPVTWLFEPDSYRPMAKLVGDESFSIITDHIGTPIAMHDAQGEAVWSAQVDVWGRLTQWKGERSDCPFRWPGQYEDAETGLYYNGFRYYDPDAGSYISRDPLGPAAGGALYAYVHDPLVWMDPLGLAHSMLGSLIRDGEVIHEAPYESGGTTGRKNQSQALETHTERKFLADVADEAEPGDTLHMRGELDPCRPGCQPAIRQVVAENGVDAVYESTSTGRTYKWSQWNNPALKGDVLQEVYENGVLKERWRYYRSPSGRSVRKKVPCGG